MDLGNDNKRQVAIGVADTGSGLDPRNLQASETGVLTVSGTNSKGYSHGASNSGFAFTSASSLFIVWEQNSNY